MMPDPRAYLIRYGSPSCTDLHGAFFTPGSDVRGADAFPLLYAHGNDPVVGKAQIGEGYAVPDAVGLRIGYRIDATTEHARAIVDLLHAGFLGWSAGASYTERERIKGADWLRRFDICEASLTPSPAEPWRYPNPVVEPFTDEQIKANTTRPQSQPIYPGVDGWMIHQRVLHRLYQQDITERYHAET